MDQGQPQAADSGTGPWVVTKGRLGDVLGKNDKVIASFDSEEAARQYAAQMNRAEPDLGVLYQSGKRPAAAGPVPQKDAGASSDAQSSRKVKDLIARVQQEFPEAHIRVTGRARTMHRQAELMAKQIRSNPQLFNQTYRPAAHIKEMNQWVKDHPRASYQQTVAAFETIIRRARANGAVVSNHLSDSARDISWPTGNPQLLSRIESRIRELGGRVIREPDASGGKHWHIDLAD
jgi:hypothetical protein